MEFCEYCGDDLGYLPFKCRHCNGSFCSKHRLSENHDCTLEFPQIAKKTRSNRDTRSSYSARSTTRYPRSKRTGAYNYKKILGLLGTTVIFIIITLSCPIGFRIEMSTPYYSIITNYWIFGTRSTVFLYNGINWEVIRHWLYTSNIEFSWIILGTISLLLIIVALILLLFAVNSVIKFQVASQNPDRICLISGLLLFGAPILFAAGTIFSTEPFFTSYFPSISFFASIMGSIILFYSYYQLKTVINK